MKKIILLFALFAAASAFNNVQAQLIEKGSLMVGGEVSFVGDEITKQIAITPKIGYFVANNIAVGGEVAFLRQFDVATWVNLGAFVREYLNFGLFFEQNFGVSVVSVDGGGSSTGGIIGVGAGYAAFLNDNVALEPQFNLGVGIGGGEASISYGFGIGIQAYLGRD